METGGPEMSFIVNRIRAWRLGYTGITGVNQLQNNLKMMVVLLIPFLGIWFVGQYVIQMEMVPKLFAPVVLLLTLGAWVMYVVGYWAFVKTDATNYKVFPSATVYYPDGGVREYDFLVGNQGISERCKFKDGSVGVEMKFINRYLYDSRDMPFPYVFEEMLLRIPSVVGETFKFQDNGEFWHKNMIVETPNCEHISIFVYEWIQENGKWKPVGALNDCTLRYGEALKKFRGNPEMKLTTREKQFEMKYKNALKREDEIKQYAENLESRIEVQSDQQGKTVHKLAKDAMNEMRSRVSTIMDTSESIWKRVFNFGNIFRFVLILLLVVLVYYFLTEVLAIF